MKCSAIAGLVVAVLAQAAVCQAQDFPKMPAPEKEHEWLEQLAGEWDAETEIFMEPGQPPLKSKGTESARMIGGFWLLAENKGAILDMPMTGILTIGYDPEAKKYVGTWVDSMTSHHWEYEGAVDKTGKVLTLNTRGPCPKKPGTLSNFKEVIELKEKDHKTFTSSMQEEDGTWTKMVVINFKRRPARR